MPSAPPDPDAVARFAAGLGLSGDARLGLAVSGGPDSLALLLLAHAARPGRIMAATVDHGLRPEAGAEADMVAQLCAERGIPHAILRPERPLAAGGNVQERARILRYDQLGRWARAAGLRHVATAHHRDDVAEGFLLRALRGAGVGGLARMAANGPMPYAEGVALLRPLLGWSRADLAAIVTAAGLTPALDPSNADPRYDRARIRALLARCPELDPEPLARAATNLADAEAALGWAADAAWQSRARNVDPGIDLDPADLPREIRRRLCRRAVMELAPDWDGEGLDRLFETIEAGQVATLAGVRVAPGMMWHFRLAPPRGGTSLS